MDDHPSSFNAVDTWLREWARAARGTEPPGAVDLGEEDQAGMERCTRLLKKLRGLDTGWSPDSAEPG
jgi:hypothetical protein